MQHRRRGSRVHPGDGVTSMHPTVYRAFERLSDYAAGERVLEIGATPDASSLFNLPFLQGKNRLGLNLFAAEFDGVRIIEANANDIPFEDDTFDIVLSNATLEHDPFFWRSVGEMRRVLAPGGVLMLGVPGFVRSKAESLVHRVATRLPWVVRHMNPLASATLTFKVHFEEGRFGDYYRFSRMAVEEVLFAEMEILALESVMSPPRFVGAARKPARSERSGSG
jgi:SAM-dependent methyltransferase